MKRLDPEQTFVVTRKLAGIPTRLSFDKFVVRL